MRTTERVRDIIEMNVTDHYVPLVLMGETTRVFPLYHVRIMEDDVIAVPVTGATGIQEAIGEASPANMMVCDRFGGYEAYILEGEARFVTDDENYDLVAEMRNIVPEFPIHAAIEFKVKQVHLSPPP